MKFLSPSGFAQRSGFSENSPPWQRRGAGWFGQTPNRSARLWTQPPLPLLCQGGEILMKTVSLGKAPRAFRSRQRNTQGLERLHLQLRTPRSTQFSAEQRDSGSESGDGLANWNFPDAYLEKGCISERGQAAGGAGWAGAHSAVHGRGPSFAQRKKISRGLHGLRGWGRNKLPWLRPHPRNPCNPRLIF